MTVLSIALISSVLLALQIVLMQAIGYAQGHHLAYIILSVALLGFGAGGSVLTVWKHRAGAALERWYAPALFLCALSIALLPFPSRMLLAGLEVDLLFTGTRQWMRLIGLGGVLLLPFFFGAAALSIAFSARAEKINRLYAANLAGSALGAGGILAALSLFLPERIIPLLALPALASAVLVRPRKLPVFLTLLIIFLSVRLAPDLPRSPYKALSSALLLPEAQRTGPLPHPLGRVDLVESPALRYAPDLSLRYRGTVPAPPHLFIDGEGTGVLLNPADPSALILSETPRALPFAAGNVESVLCLSPDGTPFFYLAAAHGAHVTAVESHPRIAEQLRFSLREKNVRLQRIDPRLFLSRPEDSDYDLIVFPVRGLFGGPTGLQTLGEDTLFTVEAVRSALGRLTAGGRLAFHVWIDDPLRHALRITDLASAALREEGIRQPADHIIIVRGWGSMALLAGRRPFTEETVSRIQTFADSKGFDLLWPPVDAARRHGTAGDPLDRMLAELLGPDPETFRQTYRFDIRAPTDNRPFFNQFLRLNDRGADLDFLSVSERGTTVLKTLLFLLTGAVLLLVLGPLLPLRTSPVRSPFTLLYFTGLGAGFMIFEVALIHRLLSFLGNVVTSAALVIAALLCGMGIGSVLSRRIFARPGILAGISLGLACMLLIVFKGLDTAAGTLLNVSPAIRGTILFLFMAVFAVPLGIPFPLGVRLLAQRDVRQIPWACGIDGAVAVIAAPASALLAFQTGYSALILAAGAAYLLAALGALSACTKKKPVRAAHLRTGAAGEKRAAQFLKKKGMKIFAQNVRVGRDEIDLIVREGKTIVFVEVKTRKDEKFGRPASAVNRAKRLNLSRAAVRYLKKRKLQPPYIRFDIVEIIGEAPEIRHIVNAFTLEGGRQIRW